MAQNDALRRRLLCCPLAVVVFVFGACGGASSPTAAPVGAASQAAPAASNATAGGNPNPACALSTAAEAAAVLGKSVTVAPLSVNELGAICWFIADPAAGSSSEFYIQISLNYNRTADEAKNRFTGSKSPSATPIPGLGDGAYSDRIAAGRAQFGAVKGDKIVVLEVNDRRAGARLSDALLTAMKNMLATAVTRI